MEVGKKLLIFSLGPRGRVCFGGELRVVLGRKKADAPPEQLLLWGCVVGEPFAQPLLMGQGLLNPVLGTVPPITETKAAHGVFSADRSPGSDEMHDPAPTHVSSEESNYIIETVAGTRNEASRRLCGGHGSSCMCQK